MESTQEQKTNVVHTASDDTVNQMIHTHEGEAPLDESTGKESTLKRNKALIAAITVAVILLGSASYFFYLKQYATHDPIVAKVNGVKIHQSELSQKKELITQVALTQGVDPTDPEATKQIHEQALQLVIEDSLIITAARTAGFVSTPEAITAQYNDIVTRLGSQEALNEQLAQVGLTDATLRKNLEMRILATQYIDSILATKEISVTTEEIDGYYAVMKAQSPDIPPLTEQKDEIEQFLIEQKRQLLVKEHIDELKSTATIEMIE
jgi:hypothetical protein